MCNPFRSEKTDLNGQNQAPRYLQWVVAAVVCACLAPHAVIFALQHVRGVPVWLAELARFVPYYWMLVPGVLAAVLSMALPRWWLLLGVGNVFLLVTVTMGLQWNSPGDPDVTGTHVRVLTYNVKAFQAIHRQGGFSAIEQEIRRQQPDIVALQDADGWVSARSETAPQVAPPMFGLPYVVAIGQYVVASRFPLSACVSGNIGFRAETHRYLRCEVRIGATQVQLVTVHFVSPRAALVATRKQLVHGLDAWRVNLADRLFQSRALLTDLSHLPRPLILMGDFNAQEGSLVLETLKQAGLRDTFSKAGRGYGYTHGHSLDKGLDLLRIDHVLVSPEVHVVTSAVGGGEASEHNPVVADLILSP
jgi:endonuclease/exonuclease/phosphatase family metal-dependent hydrolase